MTIFRAAKRVMEPAYQVFRGIPYAKSARWEPPEVIKKFGKVVGSDLPGPACMVDFYNPMMTIAEYQAYIDDGSISEDCLTLDIYRPNGDPFTDGHTKSPLLPIIVWFHGGGFQSGHSSQYDASNLMTEDIVVIVVQYRLGIMGFFNFWDKNGTSGGNLGLLDQQVALEFIADNAAHIGGDRNQIMIMGQGTGGSSVGYHLLNDKSAKLISSGWMQSGTPTFGRSPIQETLSVNDAIR